MSIRSIARSGVRTCTVAENRRPSAAVDIVQDGVEIGAAEAGDRARALPRVARRLDRESTTISVLAIRRQLQPMSAGAPHGSRPGSDFCRKAGASRRRAAGPREACRCGRGIRSAITGPSIAAVPPCRAKATPSPNAGAPRIARQQGAGLGSIAFAHDMRRGRRRATGAEHPFDIGRHAESRRGPFRADCWIVRREILSGASSGTNCSSSSAI